MGELTNLNGQDVNFLSDKIKISKEDIEKDIGKDELKTLIELFGEETMGLKEGDDLFSVAEAKNLMTLFDEDNNGRMSTTGNDAELSDEALEEYFTAQNKQVDENTIGVVKKFFNYITENFTKEGVTLYNEEENAPAEPKIEDFDTTYKTATVGNSEHTIKYNDDEAVTDAAGNKTLVGYKFVVTNGKTEKVTGPFYITTDKNGNEIQRYSLETVNGKTVKTRYTNDGTKNDSIEESWEEGFKNFQKVWNGPNGVKSTLTGISVQQNEDGTYTIKATRTDTRPEYPDAEFTLVYDKNGNEISRTDEKGNKYDFNGSLISAAEEAPEEEPVTVTVEKYGTGKNGSLSGIITNAYGVKYGTDEYFTIEKMVMDANPEIYGDANGNGGRTRMFDGTRHNSVIHPGDILKLPAWDGKVATPAAPTETPPAAANPPATGGGDTTPVTPTDDDNDVVPQNDEYDTKLYGHEVKILSDETSINGNNGQITRVINYKSKDGTTFKITSVYADDTQHKLLRKTEEFSDYTETRQYNYKGDSDIIDTVVITTNKQGAHSPLTCRYYGDEVVSQSYYDSERKLTTFQFLGQTKDFVDKFETGQADWLNVPDYLNANEINAIIRQYGREAKIADSAKFVHVIDAMMASIENNSNTQNDFNNILFTYKTWMGESYGEALVKTPNVDNEYIEDYFRRLTNYASDSNKNKITEAAAYDNADTNKIINDNKLNKKKSTVDKITTIYDLYSNNKISAAEAVAIMGRLYLSPLIVQSNELDETLKVGIMRLFEEAYT